MTTTVPSAWAELVDGLTEQGMLSTQLQPGMRVLEIGTGTGYTAALLAHQLGVLFFTNVNVTK